MKHLLLSLFLVAPVSCLAANSSYTNKLTLTVVNKTPMSYLISSIPLSLTYHYNVTNYALAPHATTTVTFDRSAGLLNTGVLSNIQLVDSDDVHSTNEISIFDFVYENDSYANIQAPLNQKFCIHVTNMVSGVPGNKSFGLQIKSATVDIVNC